MQTRLAEATRFIRFVSKQLGYLDIVIIQTELEGN